MLLKIKSLPSNGYIYFILFIASLIYTYPYWVVPSLVITEHNNITIHTRLAYEYFLAWREGQWLPSVAPEISNGSRVPIFQYYCATGYVLPALFMMLGFAPYAAIILNTIFWSFVGPVAFYHVFRRFGASPAAAGICSLLFLFYPDLISNLYGPGLYAEWMAIFALPVVALGLFRLVEHDTSGRRYRIKVAVASLLVGFYIPIHPVHSIFSYNLVVLLACVHAYAQRCTKSIVYILFSAFTGGLIAAWYWLPIAQDYSHLYNVRRELQLIQTTYSHLTDLLSPVFLRLGNGDGGLIAPQVGWYFFILSLLTLIFSRKISIGVIASLLFIGVVLLVPELRNYPFFHRVFFFVMWDYQLLAPLGIIGAIVTVDFLLFLQRRGYGRSYVFLLSVLTLCVISSAWQYSVGAAYKLKALHLHDAPLMEHISDKEYNYMEAQFRHFVLIGDAKGKRIRGLPNDVTRATIEGGISLTVTIPEGNAGLYQLPVDYWSGLGITVNDKPAGDEASDLLLAVAPLEEGKNVIALTNRWTIAKTISTIGLLLTLSLAWLDYAWLQRKRQLRAAIPAFYRRVCIKKYTAYTLWFLRLAAIRFFKGAGSVRIPNSIWFEAAMIAILPCLLLFNTGNAFGPDWHDHAWMTAYTSAYLQDHLSFPRVLNTQGSIGSAVTIFSGYGVYYVMGLLGIIFHPHVAILIAAYTLYCVQYGSLVLLLTRMDLPRWFASAVAAIVTFAIYPLTNLYNRGDTPECFATIALTIGIVSLVLSVISAESGQRQRWYAITLMAFGFMATAHSLTLLNAGVFMVLFCPLLLWIDREHFRRMFFALAGISIVALLLLAPFLYAYYAVAGKIKVSMDNPNFIAVLSGHIDMIEARLWPLLFPINVDVPYLEAPANMCLLAMAFLLITCVIRHCGLHRRFMIFVGLMTMLFVLYTWCTISTYPWNHLLPLALRANQYVYRLVTMINLTALCLLLGVGIWLKNHHIRIIFPQQAKTIALVICTVAACAFAQKMTHAFVVRHTGEARLLLTDEYLKPLLNERGHNAYATPTFFEEVIISQENPQIFAMDLDSRGYVILGSTPLNSTISGYGISLNPLYRNSAVNTYGIADLYEITSMPVVHNVPHNITFKSTLHPFGDVPPVQVHVDNNGWYMTNATAFIWSSISVDGKLVTVPRRHGFLYSIYLTPGDHEVSYAFTPPYLWSILNYMAFSTSVALLLYFLWLAGRPAISRVINTLVAIRHEV